MAVLRLNRPGMSPTFIDLGPCLGVAHVRYGGELVTSRKGAPMLTQPTTPARRAQMAEYKARITNPCRWVMRTGAACARTSGHNGEHQSADALRKQTLRRRAGRAFSIRPENRRRPEGYHWPREDEAS